MPAAWRRAFEELAAIEGGIEATADAMDFIDEISAGGDWLSREREGERLDWKTWNAQH